MTDSAAANRGFNEQAATNTSWVDRKKPFWLLGLLIPLIPIVQAAMFMQMPAAWIWWLAPLIVYVLIPLADFVIGVDKSNPPESAVPALESTGYYRFVVYAYVPLQILGTVLATWVITLPEMTWFGIAGAAVSLAYVNGIGINTAHELGHKRESATALYF